MTVRHRPRRKETRNPRMVGGGKEIEGGRAEFFMADGRKLETEQRAVAADCDTMGPNTYIV